MAASSAQQSDPVIVSKPASAHAINNQPGAPISRADSADVMKMPEPIIDDRLGHFHYVGRIGPANWCTGLVVNGVGAGRFAHDHWIALLCRARSHDAESGRTICVSSRSLQSVVRFPFWLGHLSRYPNRN